MRKLLPAVCVVALLGACAAETPPVVAADPWVRTTDGSQKPEMTALFINLTNPGDADVRLTGASCEGDVAEHIEVHEMVERDGSMVMQKTTDGLVVPAGSHLHLAPGGPHVMLMGLSRALPAGSEEIACTLDFDNGQKIDIKAPVKKFTEEQDVYHEH